MECGIWLQMSCGTQGTVFLFTRGEWILLKGKKSASAVVLMQHTAVALLLCGQLLGGALHAALPEVWGGTHASQPVTLGEWGLSV